MRWSATSGLVTVVGLGLALGYSGYNFTTTYTHVASTAAELRWERLVAEWVGCIALTSVCLLGRVVNQPQYMLWTCWLAWDHGGNAAWSHCLTDVIIWGAPAHISCAAVCAALVLLCPANHLTQALLWPGSLGLLVLGFLWNLVQAGGRQGWAWDWIEAGPLSLIFGLAWQSHRWGQSLGYGLPAYPALLQVSRASMLASAHHLQLPAAHQASIPRSVSWSSLPSAWWAALYAVCGRRQYTTQRARYNQQGKIAAKWSPHILATSVACAALAPAWVVPASGVGLAGCATAYWGWSAFRHGVRRTGIIW